MRAFIIRPFGSRKGIDFDEIERRLIRKALDSIDAAGGTTGEIMEAGNIRIDMFQALLAAELVVADITTNNPNVFYELGIRHALQEKRTFLIRAKLPKAETVEALKESEVPFDLKTDRYLEYDPANPEESLPRLTEALRLTAASPRQDSPVFLSIPNLRPQDPEQFIPVPLRFGEEVQRAEKDGDGRKLTLLGLEARGFLWESTGLRAVGRALVSIKRYAGAKTAWESLREVDEYDLEANINLGQHLSTIARPDWFRSGAGASTEASYRTRRISPKFTDSWDETGKIGGQAFGRRPRRRKGNESRSSRHCCWKRTSDICLRTGRTWTRIIRV